MKSYDYVVLGGGIIGVSIARSLSEKCPGRKIALLEKEKSVGLHASGRNSGVIHSGINQKPGSLKARFCLEGSRRLRDYCRNRSVPMAECGTLVVGRNDKELGVLETLLEMGKSCGVPGLGMLTGDQLRAREPLAAGQAALFSPAGATVESLALLESLAEDARRAGVDFYFEDYKALRIEPGKIFTKREPIEAGHIVNCAGLYADKIAHQVGIGRNYRIIPFRGEYMEVHRCEVKTMIYQPPDLRFPFLSIHLTRETDGRVLAGPSAILAFGREAYDKEWNPAEMIDMFSSLSFWKLMTRPDFLKLCSENFLVSVSKHFFFKEVKALVTRPDGIRISPFRAGIRAQMIDSDGKLVNDLLVERGEKSTHVLNAVSPGMTCSLAFADHVVDQYILG
jgi:L-2-hydroxyglutarate oxidase